MKAKDLKPRPIGERRAGSKRPIDTSDVPPITQADLDSGRVRVVKRKPKASKVSLTLRLDEDVVDAFKAGGEGYQTRINDALRRYLALTDKSSDPKAKLDQIAALVDELRDDVA